MTENIRRGISNESHSLKGIWRLAGLVQVGFLCHCSVSATCSTNQAACASSSWEGAIRCHAVRRYDLKSKTTSYSMLNSRKLLDSDIESLTPPPTLSPSLLSLFLNLSLPVILFFTYTHGLRKRHTKKKIPLCNFSGNQRTFKLGEGSPCGTLTCISLYSRNVSFGFSILRKRGLEWNMKSNVLQMEKFG